MRGSLAEVEWQFADVAFVPPLTLLFPTIPHHAFPIHPSAATKERRTASRVAKAKGEFHGNELIDAKAHQLLSPVL